jgi:hypothetical protein
VLPARKARGVKDMLRVEPASLRFVRFDLETET